MLKVLDTDIIILKEDEEVKKTISKQPNESLLVHVYLVLHRLERDW